MLRTRARHCVCGRRRRTKHHSKANEHLIGVCVLSIEHVFWPETFARVCLYSWQFRERCIRSLVFWYYWTFSCDVLFLLFGLQWTFVYLHNTDDSECMLRMTCTANDHSSWNCLDGAQLCSLSFGAVCMKHGNSASICDENAMDVLGRCVVLTMSSKPIDLPSMMNTLHSYLGYFRFQNCHQM